MAAWLERKESTDRKEKEKNILDSYRPFHGQALYSHGKLRTRFTNDSDEAERTAGQGCFCCFCARAFMDAAMAFRNSSTARTAGEFSESFAM
jgi:hypothetical protein